MSILGKIFNTDKTIEKSIDVISNGFDKLVYTKEEQSEDFAKSVSEARKMLIDWVASSQGHRLSRRVIALAITFTWLFGFIFSYICSVVAIWSDKTEEWRQTAEVIMQGTATMQNIVLIIIGFYFAAPHLSDIVKPAVSNLFHKKKIMQNSPHKPNM